MIAALLLSLLTQAPATAPAQTSPAPAGPPASNEDRIALLHYYRLQYFHRAAAEQGCSRAHPERTQALDARYDAVERRLFPSVEAVSKHSGTDQKPDSDECLGGIILNGYENALGTLEMLLAGAAR